MTGSGEKSIRSLDPLGRGIEASRPVRDKCFRSKYIWERKIHHTGAIVEHKARLLVCGNAEAEIEEESSSALTHFAIIKLFIGMAD